MAVGLPVKANYAAGDILTATNMNDLSGTFNNVATSYGQAGGKNAVINSAMQVWQRGTSVAVTGSTTYTADRWKCLRGSFAAGATVSRQATNDTTNLPFIQYAARVQRNSGNTATDTIYFYQPIETINSIPYAGKTVTVSFYARLGSNFSGASSVLSVEFSTGTGTDQDQILSYTGKVNAISQNATMTSTWQRFSYTATLAATSTEMGITFFYTPVGTASTNDYFEVTGVQIEAGSIATPFQTASGGSIQGELAMCQRYYQQGNYGWAGTAVNTTTVSFFGNFPTMRTAPSVGLTAALKMTDAVAADYTQSSSNIPISNGTRVTTSSIFIQPPNFTGLTAYRPYFTMPNEGGQIQLSAEL